MNYTDTNPADNLSCPYDVSSISAIINLIKNGTLYANTTDNNVRQIANECGDICQTLIGNGNPDLTGVGLFAHYTIQGALTAILLGVPFAISSYLVKHPKLSDVLSKLRRTFLEFNVYAVVTITISCFVRFFQYASMYEITVVPSIINFEAWIILLCLYFYPSTEWSVLDDTEAPWSKEFVYLTFLLLTSVSSVVMFVCAMYSTYDSEGARDMLAIYGTMFSTSTACGGSSSTIESFEFSPFLSFLGEVLPGILPMAGFVYLVLRFMGRKCMLKRLTGSALWKRLPVVSQQMWTVFEWIVLMTICAVMLLPDEISTMGYLPFTSVCIVVWFLTVLTKNTGASHPFASLLTKVGHSLKGLQSSLYQFRGFSISMRYLGLLVWLVPYSILLVAIPVAELVTIQIYRHALQEMLLNQDSENDWGVGQVAALLAWLPLLIEAAAEIVKFYQERRRKRSAQASPEPKKVTNTAVLLDSAGKLPGVQLQSMSSSTAASISSHVPSTSAHHGSSRPSTPISLPAINALDQINDPIQTPDPDAHATQRTATSSSIGHADSDQTFHLHSRATLAMEEGTRTS